MLVTIYERKVVKKNWTNESVCLEKHSSLEEIWFFFSFCYVCSTDSLSSLSQSWTLAFQSQVCLEMSKAKPVGHRTDASLVTPFSPASSHLKVFNHSYKFCSFFGSSFENNSFLYWTFLPDYITTIAFSGQTEIFISGTIFAEIFDVYIGNIFIVLSFDTFCCWYCEWESFIRYFSNFLLMENYSFLP